MYTRFMTGNMPDKLLRSEKTLNTGNTNYDITLNVLTERQHLRLKLLNQCYLYDCYIKLRITYISATYLYSTVVEHGQVKYTIAYVTCHV